MLATCSNPECANYFDCGPARLRVIEVQNDSYMVVWMCEECSRQLDLQTHELFSPLAAPGSALSTRAWA
jgi:hypothetical protein